MAKILLTNPPWQSFHTLQVLFPNIPPLGLQIVAGVLRAAGHEALVADVQHLRPLHPEFIKAIEEFKPDIIGFSNSELPNAPMVVKVAREVKRRYPGVKLLAGGQAPSFRPELFLGPAGPFDAVALYEAESTVVRIVDALASGAPLDNLPGCAWCAPDGCLRRSAEERVICDLDTQPMPYWEGSLKKSAFSDGLFAALETSRGCPFRCAFCSVPGYYGAPRYKSAARILGELRRLKALGVAEFSINDDSFATRPQVVLEIFETMLRERMNLRFGVQIRADIIVAHPALIELGARAGMFMAVVGFEGYTSAVQEESNKGNSAAINREASRILRRNGVAVYGTHVFGGPQSGLKDSLATFLYGRLNSDIFRMTIYTPVPGSRLYDDLADSSQLTSENPADFYEGKYLIKGAHNPLVIQLSYYFLLALHYALPDTLFKLFHPDEVIRCFMRRAYCGAVYFVLGQASSLFKRGSRSA
ncbi:MAG: radical SAM protein [Elusimicrobiota bacterium]|nr:radical SAM protein [Elusimicrobiota bacterium]